MVQTENTSLNGSLAIESQELIFNTVKTTLYSIVALLALIYSLPILCIRRFQHRNNIFTLNVCLTTSFSCLLWLPYWVYPLISHSSASIQEERSWLYILQIVSDMAIPFSFVLVSFHRCYSIVYPHKRFFRTKTWMLVCFVAQWVLAAILSIPDFLHLRGVGLTLTVKLCIRLYE